MKEIPNIYVTIYKQRGLRSGGEPVIVWTTSEPKQSMIDEGWSAHPVALHHLGKFVGRRAAEHIEERIAAGHERGAYPVEEENPMGAILHATTHAATSKALENAGGSATAVWIAGIAALGLGLLWWKNRKTSTDEDATTTTTTTTTTVDSTTPVKLDRVRLADPLPILTGSDPYVIIGDSYADVVASSLASEGDLSSHPASKLSNPNGTVEILLAALAKGGSSPTTGPKVALLAFDPDKLTKLPSGTAAKVDAMFASAGVRAVWILPPGASFGDFAKDFTAASPLEFFDASQNTPADIAFGLTYDGTTSQAPSSGSSGRTSSLSNAIHPGVSF